MEIQAYLAEIRTLHASGQSTEHSFRPALARLFASIDKDVAVINEPKRLTDVGAPDFVFNRGGIAIGWAEAKDIGKDVRKFAANDYSKDQKARYAKGLPNLIYTNGLDFEFIRKGEPIAFVTIADLIPTMPARADSFPLLESLLRDFVAATPISITTAKQLAEMMAGKAAIIKDIMGRALAADIGAERLTDLAGQYQAFKANLIHDIRWRISPISMPKPSPMACSPRACMITRWTVSAAWRRWNFCPNQTRSCGPCSAISPASIWMTVSAG